MKKKRKRSWNTSIHIHVVKNHLVSSIVYFNNNIYSWSFVNK